MGRGPPGGGDKIEKNYEGCPSKDIGKKQPSHKIPQGGVDPESPTTKSEMEKTLQNTQDFPIWGEHKGNKDAGGMSPKRLGERRVELEKKKKIPGTFGKDCGRTREKAAKGAQTNHQRGIKKRKRKKVGSKKGIWGRPRGARESHGPASEGKKIEHHELPRSKPSPSRAHKWGKRDPDQQEKSYPQTSGGGSRRGNEGKGPARKKNLTRKKKASPSSRFVARAG